MGLHSFGGGRFLPAGFAKQVFSHLAGPRACLFRKVTVILRFFADLTTIFVVISLIFNDLTVKNQGPKAIFLSKPVVGR